MDNVILSSRGCSLSTPHRSSRLYWYSLSSSMPLLSHCFSTVMVRTLPLRLKLSCRSTLHLFSSTYYKVTASHSLNTNFPFFDNNFSYPSDSFTHVTPFVVILLPYRDLQCLDPCFFSPSISLFTFFCTQQWAHFLLLEWPLCQYSQTSLLSWSVLSALESL